MLIDLSKDLSKDGLTGCWCKGDSRISHSFADREDGCVESAIDAATIGVIGM